MKVYISGPMTGLPELNFPAFDAAAEKLRRLGFEVSCPTENGMGPGCAWAEYLRADLRQLLDCSALLMLPGWQQSKGAKLERHVAHELGFMIAEDVADLVQARMDGV